MDLETVSWLSSDAGRAVIASAAAYDDDAHARAAAGDATAVDPLKAATALRRAQPGLDPGLAAAALTQVRLRRRARPRLGDDVDLLLLTTDGAEQASRTVVADLRAHRYAESGATRVADLGCGLGLDSIAFARAGLHVTAVELDPATAVLAAANAAALGLTDLITMVTGDVTDEAVLGAALADVDSAFLDPARRDPHDTRAGRSTRLSDPRSWSPPWSWVERVAALVPRTAAKVAPGVAHEMTPPGGCATWTSVDGQLLEAELAWPALASAATRRRAVVVRDDTTTVVASPLDLVDETPPPVGEVGSWLHEPDDALIRAGLVGEVATRVGGHLLDPRVAYVSTDLDIDLGALSARFAVRRSHPYTLDSLRATLVADGVGHVVVKKRAIDADPDVVRRALRLPPADGSAIVLLTRIGSDPWAIVCSAPEAGRRVAS